jgi:hypothetical protein
MDLKKMKKQKSPAKKRSKLSSISVDLILVKQQFEFEKNNIDQGKCN